METKEETNQPKFLYETDEIKIDGTIYRYGIIYSYTNILNNKMYIGQTIKEHDRYNAHMKGYIYDINKPTCKSHFHHAIAKYGVLTFKYSIMYCSELFENTSENRKRIKDTLNELEKFYIELFDTITNGYNMVQGGSFQPMKYKLRNNVTNSRVILQYTLDGAFIKLYNNAVECQEETGLKAGTIAGNARIRETKGLQFLSFGYLWKFIEDT